MTTYSQETALFNFKVINLNCIFGYVFFSPIAYYLSRVAKRNEDKDVLIILAKFLPATRADIPGAWDNFDENYIKPFLIRDFKNRTVEIEECRQRLNKIHNYDHTTSMSAILTGFGIKSDNVAKTDAEKEAEAKVVPVSPASLERRKALGAMFGAFKKA